MQKMQNRSYISWLACTPAAQAHSLAKPIYYETTSPSAFQGLKTTQPILSLGIEPLLL